MNLSRIAAAARPVTLVAGSALFVDLFLDWREVSVRTPGVAVDAGASAWSGWGAVAGVLLLTYLVLDLAARRPVAAAAVALLASGFTVVEFFTGEATVDAGAVSVSTSDALWPAYLGLALAVVLAVGAAARLAEHTRTVGVVRPHGAA
jgi:hypothetical protein